MENVFVRNASCFHTQKFANEPDSVLFDPAAGWVRVHVLSNSSLSKCFSEGKTLFIFSCKSVAIQSKMTLLTLSG